VTLSPYVEQWRWPFSWLEATSSTQVVIVPEPYPVFSGVTQEQVDRISVKAQSQLSTVATERDSFQKQLAAITGELEKANRSLDQANIKLGTDHEQIADLNKKLEAARSPSPSPRFNKVEVLRLQREVFEIHEVLNAASQKLHDPLVELSQSGLQTVDRNGKDKSIEMLNSYVDTLKTLFRVLVIENPQKFKYDWSDLSALTDGDRETLNTTIVIVAQYQRVLAKSGDFRSNILQYLPSEQSNMAATIPAFFSWLNNSIQRCEGKKIELQQELQYAVD
jgi:ABC-type transporter Mla subunit MlaD